MKVDGTSIVMSSIEPAARTPLPRVKRGKERELYSNDISICLDELESGFTLKRKKRKEQLKGFFGEIWEKMQHASGERGLRASFEAKQRL